jgi:hypothetical protein
VFLLFAVPVGFIVGYFRGGRLANLGDVRIRYWYVAFVALFIQLPIFSDAFSDNAWLVRYGTVLYIISFIMLFFTLLSNWRLFGLPALTLGAALNFIAIIANGGHMPVVGEHIEATMGTTAAAEVSSGQVLSNVAIAGEHTRLLFLGDVIPMPSFMPFANVFSIGDILIALGTVLIIVSAMSGQRTGTRTPAPTQTLGVGRDG